MQLHEIGNLIKKTTFLYHFQVKYPILFFSSLYVHSRPTVTCSDCSVFRLVATCSDCSSHVHTDPCIPGCRHTCSWDDRRHSLPHADTCWSHSRSRWCHSSRPSSLHTWWTFELRWNLSFFGVTWQFLCLSMSHARYFEVFSALYDFQKRQSSHFLRLKQLSPGHYIIIHRPTPRYFEMDELKKEPGSSAIFLWLSFCLLVVCRHAR